LSAIQAISTIPGETKKGFSTAEISVHPSGRFVYASNRGHDSIAVFRIDTETGQLTAVQFEPTGGRNPRNFVIDPSGRYLLAANQNSNSVVVFAIDQESGALTPTGKSATVPRPVCLKFAR
jgi:6-phosphogluconolactonase